MTTTEVESNLSLTKMLRLSLFTRKSSAEKLENLVSRHGHHIEDGPLRDEHFQEISSAMRAEKMPDTWADRPRLYFLLAQINKRGLMDTFIQQGHDDSLIPYKSLAQLPQSEANNFSRLDRKDFLAWQSVCTSDAFILAQGGHLSLSDGNILFEKSRKRLGEGSNMQTLVDRVTLKATGQVYARKRISRKSIPLDVQNQKAFQRELGSLRRLGEHEHLVRVCGTYTDGSYFALLLQPVAQFNLLEFLSRDTSLDRANLAMLRRWFGCMAQTLSFLHGNKIIHKDIKSQNFLVHYPEKDPANPQILLTDFGTSFDFSLTGHSMTKSNTNDAHTAFYSAPEVLRDGDHHRASDIWSLGVVFVEMLTVLMGSSIPKFHEFLGRKGTKRCAIAQNREATVQWLHGLCQFVTPTDETALVEWIAEMLHPSYNIRPDAAQTAEFCSQHLLSSACCMNDEDDLDSVNALPLLNDDDDLDSINALPLLDDDEDFGESKSEIGQEWNLQDRNISYDPFDHYMVPGAYPVDFRVFTQRSALPSTGKIESAITTQFKPAKHHTTVSRSSLHTGAKLADIAPLKVSSNQVSRTQPGSGSISRDTIVSKQWTGWFWQPKRRITKPTRRPHVEAHSTKEPNVTGQRVEHFLATLADDENFETMDNAIVAIDDPMDRDSDEFDLGPDMNYGAIRENHHTMLTSWKRPKVLRSNSQHAADRNDHRDDALADFEFEYGTTSMIRYPSDTDLHGLSTETSRLDTEKAKEWRAWSAGLSLPTLVKVQPDSKQIDGTGFWTPPARLDYAPSNIPASAQPASSSTGTNTSRPGSRGELPRSKQLKPLIPVGILPTRTEAHDEAVPERKTRQHSVHGSIVSASSLDGGSRVNAPDGTTHGVDSLGNYLDTTLGPKKPKTKITWESATTVMEKLRQKRDNVSVAPTSVISARTRSMLQGGPFLMRINDKTYHYLPYFVQLGKVGAVRELLLGGCNPGTVEKPRYEPVFHAVKGASAKHNKCLLMLIQHGADIRRRIPLNKKTFLHCAVASRRWSGFAETIYFLLKAGANPNIKDKNGVTPLLVLLTGPGPSSDEDREALFHFLAPEFETAISIRNPINDDNIIHMTVRRQDPVALDAVLNSIKPGQVRKAMLAEQNTQGMTPIHIVLQSCPFSSDEEAEHSNRLLELLLEAKADANAANAVDGSTPLHTVIEVTKNADAVELLLRFGADWSGKGARNISATALLKHRARRELSDPWYIDGCKKWLIGNKKSAVG